MSIPAQIEHYIDSLSEPKKTEMQWLHLEIQKARPEAQLWFLTGMDEKGKVVSNPNIGYGHCIINYANGSQKAFYQVGLSATSKGISVYFFGLSSKNELKEKYSTRIGKANITSYCISFKNLAQIDKAVLLEALFSVLDENCF